MLVDTPAAVVSGILVAWMGFQLGIPHVLHTMRQFLGAMDSSCNKDDSISSKASGNKYKNIMVGSGNSCDWVIFMISLS